MELGREDEYITWRLLVTVILPMIVGIVGIGVVVVRMWVEDMQHEVYENTKAIHEVQRELARLSRHSTFDSYVGE